jgi:hypothetical protein
MCRDTKVLLEMDYTVNAGYFSMNRNTFQLDLRKNQMISYIIFLHIGKIECDRIFFPTLIKSSGIRLWLPSICTTVQKMTQDFKVNNEIQECYYHHLNAFSETKIQTSRILEHVYSKDMIEPSRTDIIIILPCKLHHFKE